MIGRQSDRYDGCYNCGRRLGTKCPEQPKGIVGDGPCKGHVLMTSFQYSKSAQEAYLEFNGGIV